MFNMTISPSTPSVPTFDLADRLGKALQYGDVSVQEMARELGVSRNTVGNYINRRTNVPRAVMIVWALRTGVPLEWLQYGTDPSAPGTPDGDGVRMHYVLHGQRRPRSERPSYLTAIAS